MTTITNHADVMIQVEAYRKAHGTGERHHHLWVRDDRPGWREYVCLVCARSFGVSGEDTPMIQGEDR